MHTCVRARTQICKNAQERTVAQSVAVWCAVNVTGDPVKAGIRGSESLLGPSERPFFSSYKLTLVQTCVVVDHF